MLMFFRKKEEGFTLIELLIVVIILGILAVVAIPRFMNNRLQSQASSCRTNLRMLNDAIQRFAFDNAADPANIAAMVPAYIQTAPTCPGYGTTAGAAYTFNAANGGNPASITCGTTGATGAVAEPHEI